MASKQGTPNNTGSNTVGQTGRRYRDLHSYFNAVFGCRVQKITVDAGFTCPNRDGRLTTGGCIYCNQRGSGTGAHARGLSVTDQILAGKEALARRYKAKKFIAYFQAHTNTYAPTEKLKILYDEALAIDDVVGLAIGTRPDCVEESTLSLLQEYARRRMIWLEYGVQSAVDKTLTRLNRGHDFACAQKTIRNTQNRGINICAHVILGLPGETPADMVHTARMLAELGIDGVKLHLLYVVRGTALETMYRQKEFQCLEQNEYVDRVCDFLEHLPPDVIIQRLTGDPHTDELVAPRWALEKQATLTAINDALAARNTCQGKRWEKQKGSS